MVGGVVSLDPGRFWRITRHALTRTLWMAQFSPAPWRLPAQRCLDEMLSYAASSSFDELLRQIACGDEQLGAPRGSIGAPPVIGGGRRRRDHVCFTRQAARAIELFPDARSHWFERSGHFPHWDEPQASARLILDAPAPSSNLSRGISATLEPARV